MIRRLLTSLWRDEQGAALTEFALIAPVLLLTLLGLFDLAYNMYTNEMLQGAIQQAARNSTIEGAAGSTAQVDAIVTRAVQAVAPQAQLTFNRASYTNFTEISRPEDYTDVNRNGTCDGGEPFEDANGNGTWDLDPGQSGLGGARDAVLYTVTVRYRRPFPIAALIPGQSENFELLSATVLRNQPYGTSDQAAPAVGACS